jgi:hypothetical protein
MTTTKNNRYYTESEYVLFCQFLEEQYNQAKEDGLFEILRVLGLDKEHSDKDLIQAIDYFNERNGVIKEDAPMDFLTERQKNIVNQDGKFRPKLYCMFLSTRFSDAIENKSAFIQNSYKYSFDKK